MDPVYIIAFGLLAGLIIVFSLDGMLWLSVIFSMVVAGLVISVAPNMSAIKWAITMTTVVILMVALGAIVLGRVKRAPTSPLALWLFFAFVIVTIISFGLNYYPLEYLAAAKNYFQYWGLPLVLYYLVQTDKTPKRLAIAMLVIALIQPIFAILQHYFLMGAAFSGDRVGGTFGGALGMVGGSAELSMFLVAQFLVVFALAKYRVIKLSSAIALAIWFMIPVLWTQAKAVVVLIPVGMVVLYADRIKARPIQFVGVMAITFITVGILTAVYFKTAGDYYHDKRFAPTTFEEFVDKSIAYNVEDKGNTELNRTTAIVFWWQENGLVKHPLSFLFGNGLGSAKTSGLIKGHLYAEPEYRYRNLGVTLLTRLLWEVGIVGTLIYIGIYVAIFGLAGKLVIDNSIPVSHRAILSGYQASMTIIILSIPYQKGLINNQAFAAFAMFVVGYILFWHRYRYKLKADNNQHEVGAR